MMLKAMINHRLRRCTIFLCTFLLVSYAGFSAAAPPEFAGDKGFPQYVEGEFALVKQMLETNAAMLDRNAQKMDALSVQLDGVKTELKADIAALAADVYEVLVILNEPEKDIQLTTEICFDIGAYWEYAYTGKVAAGLGIEAGISGELQVELTTPGIVPVMLLPPFSVPIPMIPAVTAGISDTVCLTVPLYAVASDKIWIEDFDTRSFDTLVSSVALPVQYLLPGLAEIFGKVLPSPDIAMTMTKDGLELFDTSSSNASMLTLDKVTPKLQKTGYEYSGLNANSAVHFSAVESQKGMVQGSPLLKYIMEKNGITAAFEDPCEFVTDLGSGLPSSDAIAGLCTDGNEFLDIIDPFCVLDLLHLGHCSGQPFPY